MGARTDLATAIQDALDNSLIEPAVVVYAEPADVVKLPAVVIDADQDYITPATYSLSGPGAYMWAFVLHLTVVRSDVSSGFDLLEQLRAVIVLACNELGATVGVMSGPATVQVNDQPTLQSDLEVGWLTERNT